MLLFLTTNMAACICHQPRPCREKLEKLMSTIQNSMRILNQYVLCDALRTNNLKGRDSDQNLSVQPELDMVG